MAIFHSYHQAFHRATTLGPARQTSSAAAADLEFLPAQGSYTAKSVGCFTPKTSYS